MPFVKLRQGDDWGHKYYEWPDRGVPKYGNANASRDKIPFEDGDVVRVRYPDGTECEQTLTLRYSEVRVSDHGHSYPVGSRLPVIERTTAGIRVDIPLSEVEVDTDTLPMRRKK